MSIQVESPRNNFLTGELDQASEVEKLMHDFRKRATTLPQQKDDVDGLADDMGDQLSLQDKQRPALRSRIDSSRNDLATVANQLSGIKDQASQVAQDYASHKAQGLVVPANYNGKKVNLGEVLVKELLPMVMVHTDAIQEKQALLNKELDRANIIDDTLSHLSSSVNNATGELILTNELKQDLSKCITIGADTNDKDLSGIVLKDTPYTKDEADKLIKMFKRKSRALEILIDKHTKEIKSLAQDFNEIWQLFMSIWKKYQETIEKIINRIAPKHG